MIWCEPGRWNQASAKRALAVDAAAADRGGRKGVPPTLRAGPAGVAARHGMAAAPVGASW
jgi:hypothetical protein